MDLNKTFLTLLTPVIAAGSAWLTAAAAKYGVHLDASGINALGVAGATAGTAAMVKLIHDLEKRKQLQAHLDSLKPAEQAILAADPKAGQQLEDAVAAVQRAAEAKFQELAAKIPQPSVQAAPMPAAAPVSPVAPVPDPPAA